MDEPKYGTVFIAQPSNGGDLHLCTVLVCQEEVVTINFEHLKTGENKGNGLCPLESYNKNIANGTFKVVDEETIAMLRLLLTS